MDNKLKEILENQLGLLADQSHNPENENKLPELTLSMCEVVRTLEDYRCLGI